MYKKKTRYLSFFRVTAICFFPALFSAQLLAQSLKEVTEEECVYGSCGNGRGTLSLKTPWGLGEYIGDFRDEEFHGYGRLEIPISFTQRAVYAGNWFEVKGRGGGLTGMEKVNYILASGGIISAMVPVLTFLISQSGKKMSIQSSG